MLAYLPFRILDDGVRVRELLHASGLVAQPPVDEPARLVEDIRLAGILEEPLNVIAVSIQLDVHVVPISAADRFRYFFHHRTTVDRVAVHASFLAQCHLHLPDRHPLVGRIQWHWPAVNRFSLI